MEVVECLPPPPSLPSKPTTRKTLILPRKKNCWKRKPEEKTVQLLRKLETTDLHMKRINPNSNKNK